MRWGALIVWRSRNRRAGAFGGVNWLEDGRRTTPMLVTRNGVATTAPDAEEI
jgi:hypothetical protein